MREKGAEGQISPHTTDMASAVMIQLHRPSPHIPWGFRLQGGRDFSMQLSVKKVTGGTPADGYLWPGDAIMLIGSTHTKNLTHMQAHQLIKSAGNTLQLMVAKGQCNEDFSNIRPKGPLKFSPWKH